MPSATSRPCAGPADFPAIGEFLSGLYQPTTATVTGCSRSSSTPSPTLVRRRLRGPASGSGKRLVGSSRWRPTNSGSRGLLRPGAGVRAPAAGAARPRGAVFGRGRRAGRHELRAFVPEFEEEFTALVACRGFAREPGGDGQCPVRHPATVPGATATRRLPPAEPRDDHDPAQVDRVLWRGFNHPASRRTTGWPAAVGCSPGRTTGWT